VIGHEGVGGDPNLALFAERADEGEEMMAVLVGGEYGLFVEMARLPRSVWVCGVARQEAIVNVVLLLPSVPIRDTVS